MKINIIYLSLLCMMSLSIAAQEPVRDLIRVSPGAGDYPGSNVLTLFDSTLTEVKESGLSFVYMHKLIKILTPEGARQNNVIRIGYDPLSAYVEIRGARVYREGGTEDVIDISGTLDYPAPARAIYWGAREKMLEIGRLCPGDVIEINLFRKGFTYALLYDAEDDRYIPPMRGHFYDIVEFWSAEPVMEKVYQVDIPADKLLQYEFYNGEARSSSALRGDRMLYTFTKTNFSRPATEAGMVAPSDEFPKLLLSTSPDWNAKSLWFYGVNEDFGSFDVTPEVQAKTDELLKNAKDEVDSVSVLTHWVADNIRYSGISMGEGEGFTLHKGEMTFADRCGVCKDKAGMLITMLRAAGFESYPAMTMAGSRIDYIPADQFNHSVTIVKLSDGRYHLLDPTWVPFVRELWSSLEQQQNYLMGVPEGADLMITPVSPPENHYFRINGKSTLDADGSLTGEITIDAEGQSDAAIRRMFTGGFISTWGKSLERELLSVFPAAHIIDAGYGNPYNYTDGPINIKLRFVIPDHALVTSSEIIFIPPAISGIFRGAMSHLYFNLSANERKYAFRDRCSRLVELYEEITLPSGAAIAYAPDVQPVSSDPASFKGAYSIQGNILKVSETVTLRKRIYDPEDWSAFKEVVQNQKKMAEEPVILKIIQ
ncbi:MAG: DUF3857 and transglutaminase domain-containing protein [Bacteroidales bacterium]|nr:DUF3857 and transglutaminase domain-containing protein [Bacteroidales bacterium]